MTRVPFPAVDGTPKKIGSYKRGTPMAKKQATAQELKALLNERIAGYSVGRESNPQWIKIVSADSDEEGANWKVAHSPKGGAFWDAIEREMPELQKLYDLKEEPAAER